MVAYRFFNVFFMCLWMYWEIRCLTVCLPQGVVFLQWSFKRCFISIYMHLYCICRILPQFTVKDHTEKQFCDCDNQINCMRWRKKNASGCWFVFEYIIIRGFKKQLYTLQLCFLYVSVFCSIGEVGQNSEQQTFVEVSFLSTISCAISMILHISHLGSLYGPGISLYGFKMAKKGTHRIHVWYIYQHLP